MARRREMVASSMFDTYQRLDYLQSDGNQHINTGIYGESFDTIDASLCETTHRNWCAIVGNYKGSGYANTLIGPDRHENSFQVCLNTTTLLLGDLGLYDTLKLVNLAFNGTTLSFSVDGTTQSGTFTQGSHNDIPVWLFSGGTIGTYSAIAKIAFIKFSKDGAVVKYFVPVLHEEEGKMLDLVHNVLYSNLGTGSLTYGGITGTIVVPRNGWGQNIPSDTLTANGGGV